MARIFAVLAPSRSARRLGVVAAGAAVGQAMLLLAMPVLTRLYSAADFGTLAVFTAIVGILGAVAALRLDLAVGLPASAPEAAAVAWSGLAATAVVAGLVAVAGAACAEPLGRLLGAADLASTWWLVALTVAVMGIYQVTSAWAIRAHRYAAVGLRDCVAAVVQAGTQIGLGLVGPHPAGLLLGPAAGRAAGIGSLAGRDGLFRQPRPTLSAMRRAVSRYRGFPLVASWSGLLNTAGTHAPLLVVAAYCDQAEVGLVGLAVRCVGAPTTLVVTASARVFAGETAEAVRERRPVLGSAVRSTVRRLFLIGLVPAVALAVLGPALFGLLFGDGWRQAGVYAGILAAGNLARFAVGGVSQTLVLLERQSRQLRWDAFRLALTAGLTGACLAAGASVAAAVAVLSAAYLAVYGLLLLECLRAAHQFDQTVEPAPR